MDRLAKLVSGRLKAQPAIGSHPAPELLAAFAENALPEADRGQLLQHLGACSDCREILYVALPDSSEAQQVLVLKPRPFRRWASGWGALVASVAIVVIFFSANRLGHKNHAASMVESAPAGASETETKTAADKIAAEKTPPDLDQIQAARDASKTKVAVALARPEAKPQPEARHMTAKMQAQLEFEQSGEVHMRAQQESADAMAGLVSKRDERQKENPGVAVLNGTPSQTGSAGKLGNFAYSRTELAKSRADQQAAVAQKKAVPADAVSESNSVQADIRNAPSPSLPSQESTVKGNLGGMILDPSGAVVGNARVTMVGPVGAKTATSDPQGRFVFDLLTPGSYSIKAEASGFKATEIKQVAVLDNKTSALQIRLEPGSASEVVEVSAAAPVVDKAVEVSGANPVLDSSTGFVAPTQQTAAQLSVQRSAVAKSRQPGIGSGAGVSTLQWTLSPEGAVQRSADSGRTWQAVSVVTGATFRGLSAVGANIWVGGKAGALYHSTDSGQTWAKFEPAAAGKKLDQDIVRVDFSDELSGTVNTANDEAWTTSDGGRNWQRK
jgi:Carboxypeptidase regulatory-like domain/Photosynthesis system II assembly factor YCF48/Putative zinc-finger